MTEPKTHDRICIRIPTAVVAKLREKGSPNQYLGAIIDSFDWHTLPYDPGFDLKGVDLEQLTIQVTVAGKAAFIDYCKYHQKEQRITLMQAIGVVSQPGVVYAK